MDTRTFESELAHFGVKGMRWGVRRRRAARSGFDEHDPNLGIPAKITTKTDKGPTPIKVKIVPGKPVQTKGGKRHPTVDEAVTAAALKQKLHTSGKQSLTNDEMRKLVDRLTLEDRLSKVAPKPKHQGLVFAQRLLKTPLPTMAVGAARGKFVGTNRPITLKQYRIEQGLDFAEKLLKNVNTQGKKKKSD